MRVTCKLYGNLRRYAQNGRESSTLDLPEGTTVKTMLESLQVPDTSWWMVAVDDQVVQPDVVLHDGDLIELFEPVGGG